MQTRSLVRAAVTMMLGAGLSACAAGQLSDESGGTRGDSASGPAGNQAAPRTSGKAGPSPGAGGSTASGAGGSGASGTPGMAAQPPPSNAGDRYKAPGTNPFVVTTHDPFSTFGVDVDTASYDIFRRDVNLGMLPRPESVRLEDYVNAFKYDYPAPSAADEAPFHIAVGAASQVFDRGTVLLRVGIQGRRPPPFERRPANLVFLVDVSGSMHSPEKLPLVKKTLVETLEYLDPKDKVSIVTYAGATAVRLGPTPVSERTTIERVINSFESGGGTAGGAGLQLAYEQVQAGFIEGGINHILMCTDGDFNVGLSSTKDMLELIREKRKTGATLTVLGYGVGNLNDDLMEAVSNAGNGIYGVISDEEHMRKYVRERMLSTIVHIAKDVKIQVEFNAEAVAAYRLLGYEDRAIADTDFRNDVVDAGEIGAGHQVTALYELVLAGGKVPAAEGAPPPVDGTATTLPREVRASDLVMVKVRWKTVDATLATPAREVTTVLGKDGVLEGLAAADRDLQWAAAVASLAEILKDSPYADRKQLESIRQIVRAQADRDDGRQEMAALLTKASGLLR